MPNQRGFIPVILLITLVALGMVAAAYYVKTTVIGPPLESFPLVRVSPAPLNSVRPSPATTTQLQTFSMIHDQFSNYRITNTTVVGNTDKEQPTQLYTSQEFGIAFLYPKGLYLNDGILPGRGNTLGTQLLVAMTNTPESKYYPQDSMTQKDYIDYSIECRTDPDPGGICAEGVAPWFDVTIVKNADVSEFSLSPEVESVGDIKALSSTAPNLDGTTVNVYQLWMVKNGTNYVVTVSSKTNISRDPDYRFALWLLANSFQVF